MALQRAWNQLNFQSQSAGRKFCLFICAAASLVFFVHYHHYAKNLIEIQSISYSNFEEVENLRQDDRNLIDFIRRKELIAPLGLPYNLSNPGLKDFSQYQQGLYLTEFFRDKVNGTFIEAGAWDGELYSNTLILERELGWKGLLIEPNPDRFPQIKAKHRKAYSSNTCISLTKSPALLSISMNEIVSHIIGYFDKNKHVKAAKVHCYPLFSLMAAMNMTTLDFLSLDLESVEVKVLQTIPWEKVNIKTLLIEVNHIPEGKDFIKKFMAERNYILEKQLNIDYFFVKKP